MSKIDREILKTLTPRRSAHVWRVAAATLRGFVAGRSPGEMLKRDYPEDGIAPLLLSRAASTQAVLTDPAWAAPLAHYSVSDAIEEIVSMTALGQLSARALRVDMGNLASVTVPGRVLDPTTAKSMWVGEGQATPVKQYSLLGSALHVHKIEVNAVVTRELSEASNIEDILRMLLTEMAGLAIDAAIFSTDAASAAKSAGILNGLTPTTVSTTTGFDGCGQDLGTLTAAVASRGGGQGIGFVAAPAQATSIRFWAGGQFEAGGGLPVAAAAVLPAGTIVALEPSSLAYSFGAPTFGVTTVAALHMDDAPAGADLIAGSASVKSMWQTDALAIKMTLFGDFVMRAPHVAFMQSVLW